MALRYYNVFQYYRNQNQYSSPLAFDDFLQEALKGVVIAIDKYDYGHTSQATFNTFAHQWIRQNCSYFMKSNASVIRQPLYKQGIERYPFNFKHIDNDNIDYLNFLGSKYAKSQDM